MQEQKTKNNTSGKVRIEGNIVFWDYQDKNIIEINLNDVLVIGEHTNSDGPWFDDWFLTFILKDGKYQSIPWYADNIDVLTQLLSKKYQEDFSGSLLTGSTDWNSITRYPTHLKGKPLFTLTPTENYKEPKTFLGKILAGAGLGGFDTTKFINLSDDIKKELSNASR